MLYDVIVVGARCAGAPLAMLLARAGLRVLLLDRDSFPSDIMSTHYIHLQGVDSLRRWGVLDQVLATGLPKLRYTRRVFGSEESVEAATGGPDAFGLCPRRVLIDKILVDAAVRAGAELRERTSVTGLLRDDRGAVSGVSGRGPDGEALRADARIVVGADGLYSRVARLVKPAEYNRVESVMCAYYSYWTDTGLPMGGISFYASPGGAVLLFPTNDDAICVAAARPARDFALFKQDLAGTYMRTLAERGLAEQVQAGRRLERFEGSGDLPHYFRKPYGPGWALVGDAGLHIDPTTGLGMTKAFSEAEMLAPALIEGLSGSRPLEEALAEFHTARDGAWLEPARENLALSCMLAGVPAPALRTWAEVQAAAA